MLRNDLPPIVIPAEDRSRYFSWLQGQDVSGMTGLLEELSERERERMEQYQDGLQAPESQERIEPDRLDPDPPER